MSKYIMAVEELRPCFVNGVKALFHRWVDTEAPIVKVTAALKDEDIRQIMRAVKNGFAPKYAELTFIKETLGIIEFEDGTVEEVKPHSIRFCDNKISEYAFPEKGAENETN